MKAESTEAGATNFSFDDEPPALIPLDSDSASRTSSGTDTGSSSSTTSRSVSSSGRSAGSTGGGAGTSTGSTSSDSDSNDVFSVKQVDALTSGVKDDDEEQEGEFY